MAPRIPDDHPRSTAQIKGHPLHPMLVVFPIAFWLGTLIADIVYWATGDYGWAEGATSLLAAGLLGAALAAVAGFIDYLGDVRIRLLKHARQHMIGNVTAMALQAINLFTRLSDGADAILPWGLVLSAVVVCVIGFTGWLGGELVYRHRVGVAPIERPRPNGKAAHFNERPPG
jgi:uncharacterized membrane protein